MNNPNTQKPQENEVAERTASQCAAAPSRTGKTSTRGRVLHKRRVRQDYRAGGQIGFKTKSFTLEDGTEYLPVIDIETGEFFCTCPDFFYRHTFCKHCQRALAQLQRRHQLTRTGFLSPLTAAPDKRNSTDLCQFCRNTCLPPGTFGQVWELVSEDGETPTGQHICRVCIRVAQVRSFVAACFEDEIAKQNHQILEKQIEAQTRIVHALWSEDDDHELEAHEAQLEFLHSELARASRARCLTLATPNGERRGETR